MDGVAFEITRDEIMAAASRIAPHVRATPVLRAAATDGVPVPVVLKLEQLQVTGSFKPRGAFNLLLTTDTSRGVAAASGGNFGLAAAHAANALGVRSTVFVPASSPRAKVDGIARLGAEVRVIPGYYPDALAACTEWAEETGALLAHAYDDRPVVAGQGTCGMELADQAEDIDTVVVAVGGGGLIGGIASWFRDDVTVVGVETEQTPALHAARAAGGPVEVEVGGVAASALGAAKVGDHAWAANRFIDDSVLVSDEATLDAQRWLWQQTRVAVEPAAATTVAALRSGAYVPGPGERLALVICGANTDLDALSVVVDAGHGN